MIEMKYLNPRQKLKSHQKRLTTIPSQARDGICPPLSLTNRAVNIGCRATRAVPAATVVRRIAKKKAMKCIANTKPPNADQAIALRSARCLKAKGAITNAPPRFRQKIKVTTGIVLNAISGPETPMPTIPINRRIESARPGIAVWL
jgi:hypothetical protein